MSKNKKDVISDPWKEIKVLQKKVDDLTKDRL